MDENKQELPTEVTAEPRIVEAVFTSSNQGEVLAGRTKSPLAKMIEQAMSDAVTQALADGIDISDSEAIRERILAARQKVKDWYNQKLAEFAAAEAQRIADEAVVTAKKAAEVAAAKAQK